MYWLMNFLDSHWFGKSLLIAIITTPGLCMVKLAIKQYVVRLSEDIRVKTHFYNNFNRIINLILMVLNIIIF